MNIFPIVNGKLGNTYKVVFVKGDIKIKRRLLELGFINTKVKILNHSFFKGVFLLQLRNFVVALRREEAKLVEVCEDGKQ